MPVLWTISTVKSDFPRSPSLRWDIFCRVIDNHGDLGVCWRLCADLAQRGHTVRLWVDDASALAWMAPQGCAGVEVHPWPTSTQAYPDCANVVIEAFGCELPRHVQARIGTRKEQQVTWINLEYLSAETYVERVHGLPSPVMSGPAKGCSKWFYYPGFTPSTGGLLREPDLLARQAAFKPETWLAQLGLPLRAQAQRVSLFCYEPAALGTWLEELMHSSTPTDLLVAPGRPHAAISATLDNSAAAQWQQNISVTQGNLTLHPLPYLTQKDFDHLLWSCHLNMVRGEDSLVRALWAGQPFIWHIYPQDDNAHHDKLEAFLDWLQAPTSLREFHLAWNGISTGLTIPNPAALETWHTVTQAARHRLLLQADLTTELSRLSLTMTAKK
jgi:uncharacterized repeat protein (TIGR03837 family)